MKLLPLRNLNLVPPGNVWQPGIPLVARIEKGREGHQEGCKQNKGEKGLIGVHHLFKSKCYSIGITRNLNISPDNRHAVVKAEENS